MKIISPTKGIVLGIIFLFIGVSVVPNISSDNPVFGNTIYVDDDADPGWYNATHVKTIQEGIDNATAGDTVFVYNGTYLENVIVNKAVNLTGEDKNNTIIDGGNSGDVVVISTDEVNISRFTIKNGGNFPMPAGIYISSNFTTVSDNNIISNSDLGILLSTSNNNTITGNIISNNGDGIRLWYSTNSTISDNIITNNYYGIRSWYSTYNIILDNNISSSHNYGLILGSSSNNNIITDNKISQNQNDGIKFDTSSSNIITNNTIGFSNYNGLNLYSSSANTITGNNIISNNNDGICLYESGYNLISRNTITNNSNKGIYLYYSHNNSISRNTITNNSGIGIDIVSSLNIRIYHNNFINNLLNAWDNQPNLWDNGYPSGGNHWDDYTGVDNYHGINQDIPGSDDIGDTPYEITGGGNNKDYYPLMVPYRAAPVISNVTAQPDPQITGGFVNITCDVTDDVGVDEVWVNITYPDFTTHNFSMNLGSYYFNQTYDMIGTYSYFIWADDTNDDSDVSLVYSFNITEVPDTVPPVISNVGAYPSTRETAGYVNISCEVTDDVDVHLVKVDVIYPDGSRINVTMEGEYYYNATYTQLGAYSYFIWASDTSGNINVSETYNFLIVRWTAVLNISESSGLNDTVIFGEAYDALDNIDSYDIPKPPTPSEPFVYTWFDANLSEPYDKLWADYRFYPDTHKVWHLYLLCSTLGPVLDSTNITISWDKSNLLKSEYTSIILNNTGSGETVSMFQQESYTFTSNNTSIPHVFQIICNVPEETFLTNLSYKWNFISLPFNQTITKTDLIIYYNGTDYNWTEAVDPANGPLIDPYIFGWKRGSSEQTYQAVNALNPGYGYWMYAYSDCELWTKNISIIPDNYITDLGEKWNTIGIPFDQPIDKTNLTITYNGTDYNWSEAIDPANGPLVDPYIFGWNRGTGGQIYQAVDVLKPGYGYWMYAYYDCKL